MIAENKAATSHNLHESLHEYFGFKQFKGEQEAIISALLNKKDVFVIMPTGGGKSLCYQLPGIISEGTAIVISPLIALMKNQVDLVRSYANDESIAHFLNSSLNKAQKDKVKADIVAKKTKLLYVAPETLTKQENIDFFRGITVSFVAIDEAHCISEWGHDFRPEYRRIREMIEQINDQIPIIALTATATPKVQQDIVKTLNMEDPQIFQSSFNRPNLYYEVRPKKNDDQAIKNIVQYVKKMSGKSGIVYVTNRKSAEKIAELLMVNGIKAAPYHAGLDNKVRSKAQDDFLMHDIDVIVATIAFGMGIDKPDIRFIVHFDIAKSLENYYQETGRAGRDGLEGECVAYFSYKDINKLEKLMRDKTVAERDRGNQLINETVAYMESGGCRRQFILHYFGEEYDTKNCDGKCDNCRNPREKQDVTEDTLNAINAVTLLKENHDIPYMVKFLSGAKAKEITQFKHDLLELYGVGKDKDVHHWNSVLRNAIISGYLRKDIEKFGQLFVTDAGRAFVEQSTPVLIPINRDMEAEADAMMVQTNASSGAALDADLLKILQGLRKQESKKKNLPPYVIFQDTSLEEMATRYPISSDEFANIVGVSKGKALRYGKKFSDVIRQYVEDNDIDRPEDFVMKGTVKKSSNKVKIIQSIDKKMSLEDISDNLSLSLPDLVNEIETIVNSGTKMDITYYLEDVMDEEVFDDVYEYFKSTESDSLELAQEEFADDGLELEDLQLVRVKFMNDFAN